MSLHDEPTGDAGASQWGRRDVLRLGGLTVGIGALVAACTEGGGGEIGRVGVAPTTAALPAAVVSDIAVLRTAASLQRSIAAVYDTALSKPAYLAPGDVALAKAIQAAHQSHAEALDALTEEAGGEAWPCGNTRYDSAVIKPIVDRITAVTPATEIAAEIPASDDQVRDFRNLLHGLESLGASTAQAFVAWLSDPALRGEIMRIGVAEARQAALWAITINADSEGKGYISAAEVAAAETSETSGSDAPSTTVQDIATPTTQASSDDGGVQLTEIPAVTAIPSAFGNLGTMLLVVGAGDENGVRLKTNLETPSLNSLVYEYERPAC